MKKSLIIAAFLVSASTMMGRLPEATDVNITNLDLAKDGSRLNIAFTYDFSHMPKGQNIETRITPVVVAGDNQQELGSIILAGRNRMIQAERTGSIKSPTTKYYKSNKVTSLPYSTSVAWQPWMENANIELVVENLGCCESRKTVADFAVAQLNMGERTFDVAMEYITPVEERVKMRNAKGEAYIDFVVNKTNILPDYRNNRVELQKIQATVDSIKSDPDTKITTLSITGYASPEGSYANNEKLAKGRTEALAEYVRKLFTFPKDLMKTAWVAEDWAGLRKMVAGSELAKKEAILAVIDSDLAPDAKDAKLKADFPTDYQYMLKNWYPALRHSDYVVAFEVRKYTDPEEIAKVFKKNPYKLSLRELFIYAETLDPKSNEYADVFTTAARMFPDDETANLNAGNIAIRRGDLTAAAEYLAKAGDTPQAEYARGVLAVKQGDPAKAKLLFDKARQGGINVSEAEAAMEKYEAPEVIILDKD